MKRLIIVAVFFVTAFTSVAAASCPTVPNGDPRNNLCKLASDGSWRIYKLAPNARKSREGCYFMWVPTALSCRASRVEKPKVLNRRLR